MLKLATVSFSFARVCDCKFSLGYLSSQNIIVFKWKLQMLFSRIIMIIMTFIFWILSLKFFSTWLPIESFMEITPRLRKSKKKLHFLCLLMILAIFWQQYLLAISNIIKFYSSGPLSTIDVFPKVQTFKTFFIVFTLACLKN